MKKKTVKHDQHYPFGGHGLDFFWASRFGVIAVYR